MIRVCAHIHEAFLDGVFKYNSRLSEGFLNECIILNGKIRSFSRFRVFSVFKYLSLGDNDISYKQRHSVCFHIIRNSQRDLANPTHRTVATTFGQKLNCKLAERSFIKL